MNDILQKAFFALSLSLLVKLSAQAESPVERYQAGVQPVVEFAINQTVDPIYPYKLKNLGYEDGSATFAIVINQYGELEDYLLLEATHIAFGEAVEEALPKWTFSPPLVDGENASIASKIKVDFKREGGIVYESFGYYSLDLQFGNLFDKAESYRVYSLKDLDKIPVPTKIEKPAFHTELLEDRELVSAVFEFYIDTEGRVRIPTLREADDKVDERLLIIAQNALSMWRFEPPLKGGKPVVAKLAQPFRFTRTQEQQNSQKKLRSY